MAVSGSTQKYFIAKVYDSNGVFKDTMHDKEFADKLNFSVSVNGTLSAMSLNTTLNYGDWTQPTGRLANINVGDRFKFFIFDKENPNGKQIYSGIFAGIEVDINELKEAVKMNFLPNSILLGRKVMRATDGNTTTKSFSSVDPADMLRYIVYNANVGIGYTPNSVREVGVSRTYDFIAQYSLDAIKKVLDLCPYGWFFYIGGDDLVYLKKLSAGDPGFNAWGAMTWGTDYWGYDPATDSVITHQINFETQVKSVSAIKTIDELTNRVLFLGGGDPQLYQQYQNTSSMNNFGTLEELCSDERVTESGTAEAYSQRIIDNKALPKTTYSCELIDSNYSKDGYDIEELRVGDKVKINTNRYDSGYTYWGAFVWGVDSWRIDERYIFGAEQFIKRIDYKQDTAVLELSIAPDPIIQRIEDINRDLTNYRFKEAPDVPDNI